MTPCPLCTLGFSQPHTKEDWKRFAEDEELGKRWVDELQADEYSGLLFEEDAESKKDGDPTT